MPVVVMSDRFVGTFLGGIYASRDFPGRLPLRPKVVEMFVKGVLTQHLTFVTSSTEENHTGLTRGGPAEKHALKRGHSLGSTFPEQVRSRRHANGKPRGTAAIGQWSKDGAMCSLLWLPPFLYD